ncbi:(d)CMP kinase [Cytophagales bacterium LB-30]|uniref:Cytidylate kinase n=1 Tax=Shiella aurantiaca TaxID=3058365 RepID=A0ABT8F826_9BACT|nr:(d)CMP kinase [Shiella aurantiaca]MDN4166534.1 (d)CMP kinase [Shiella aurantiaca]
MRRIVIAIDGYSACGKSSTAKEIAKQLGYSYIDSGAMYRAVTLYFLQNYVSLTDPIAVEKALKNIEIDFHPNSKTGANETYLNGIIVEDEIRKMEVSEKVSEVSALLEVRKMLVDQQRKLGKRKGVVMDGRDIGTVVFPQAELKIFMKADMHVRAERRQRELLEKEVMYDLQEILDNLQKRDEMDTSRKESPLRQAEDAHVVDTTHITFEEQVEEIIRLATSKMVQAEGPVVDAKL